MLSVVRLRKSHFVHHKCYRIWRGKVLRTEREMWEYATKSSIGLHDMELGSAWQHTCRVLRPASLRAAACSARGLVPREVRPPGRDRVAANSGVVYCSDCVSDIAPLRKPNGYYETIPTPRDKNPHALSVHPRLALSWTLKMEECRQRPPDCVAQNDRGAADFGANRNLACQNYETTKEDRLLSVDERITLSRYLRVCGLLTRKSFSQTARLQFALSRPFLFVILTLAR